VRESVEDVLQEIREYRASILATSYEMDRGEYRSPDPGEVVTGSSVVPFPTREER
jgi:flagellar protein FlbD